MCASAICWKSSSTSESSPSPPKLALGRAAEELGGTKDAEGSPRPRDDQVEAGAEAKGFATRDGAAAADEAATDRRLADVDGTDDGGVKPVEIDATIWALKTSSCCCK